MENLVEVKNLVKHFPVRGGLLQRVQGWVKAVDGVSFSIRQGEALGLQVNAGHGLNYQNVKPIAAMAPIRELNIGHAIIARAVFSGLDEAVREMKTLMLDARMGA